MSFHGNTEKMNYMQSEEELLGDNNFKAALVSHITQLCVLLSLMDCVCETDKYGVEQKSRIPN